MSTGTTPLTPLIYTKVTQVATKIKQAIFVAFLGAFFINPGRYTLLSLIYNVLKPQRGGMSIENHTLTTNKPQRGGMCRGKFSMGVYGFYSTEFFTQVP